MLLFQGTLSASLPPIVCNTNISVAPTIWLAFIYLRPVNAAVLSALSTTTRWNDGQVRSRTEIALLSSLGLFQSATFPIYQAGGTDITFEATLTGAGSCEVCLIGLPS